MHLELEGSAQTCGNTSVVASFVPPLVPGPPHPPVESGDWQKVGGCSEGAGRGAGTGLSGCYGCRERK